MSVKCLPETHPLYQELKLIRKFCLTKSPGFAGIALLPEYKVIDATDEQHGEQYGFTDGRTIYIGEKFFAEAPKAQAYILVHEVLHVALRHPQRGGALYKKRMMKGLPYSPQVFNWAVDAIVNHGLDRITDWLQRPNLGLITFEKLLKPDLLQQRPAHTWGAEELFVHLMDNVVMPAIKAGQCKDVSEYGEQKLPGNGDTLDIALPEEVKPDSQADTKNWENRVRRAAAGDKPGGIMKELLFDIPVTKTPWQYLLRRFVTAACLPTTQPKTTKPSRGNIMLSAFARNTKSDMLVPFSCAWQPAPGIKKIVVVVDTSGSIDDAMCEFFASEIQSIRKKTGCDLHMITCDAEVHQRINVKAHENFKNIIKAHGGFKGRGGTNFVPGVEAAEKTPGAAVIIYLTDMMGPYPNKCRLPLLWVSTEEKYSPPPCGKVVVLKPQLD